MEGMIFDVMAQDKAGQFKSQSPLARETAKKLLAWAEQQLRV